MAIEILMPALSPTMTEGTLARWLKKEGDAIKPGDIIAEIETDKATMEVEAVEEGILGRILVPAGTAGVKVNQPIALLTAPGEALPPAAASAAPASAPAAPSPTAPPAAPVTASPAPAAAQPGPAAAAPATPPPRAAEERIIASPLARRMARQAGLDLATIRGSGPNGRIVKADIEAALARRAAPAAAMAPAPSVAAPSPAAPAPSPVPAPAPAAPHRLVPHSTMRKVIARRLSEAKRTIPHFYLSMDIRLDALLDVRAQINARSAKEGPDAVKVSVNDLLIKAAARTLRRHPQVNASWSEEGMILYEEVDISVAVAIPEGLITPIVRQADRKSVLAISAEMKDLAARARAGKLKPEEYQGGGFSISNMGMYGVSSFSAIINPPQAGILAVGAGEQRPVVTNGALGIATVMTCTLSVDHRVVDGALAAEWLATFKGFVEDPLSLLL